MKALNILHSFDITFKLQQLTFFKQVELLKNPQALNL